MRATDRIEKPNLGVDGEFLVEVYILHTLHEVYRSILFASLTFPVFCAAKTNACDLVH